MIKKVLSLCLVTSVFPADLAYTWDLKITNETGRTVKVLATTRCGDNKFTLKPGESVTKMVSCDLRTVLVSTVNDQMLTLWRKSQDSENPNNGLSLVEKNGKFDVVSK